MRELNFLPTWYPKVVRQKQMLTAQAWGTAVIVVGGLATLLAAHSEGKTTKEELARAKDRAQLVIKQVNQLDEMLDLQKQLVAKQAIVSELGLPVELSRVVAEMGTCAPREVTFTNLSVVTLEQAASTISERAAATVRGKGSVTSRRLQIRLQGVAPTEGEVTTFWSRLMARPSFSAVRLVNSNEKVEGEHKMRVFEITFDIDLDPQGAA